MKSLDLTRYALSICAAAILVSGCGGSAGSVSVPPVGAVSNADSPHHKTFKYIGRSQTFDVPAGVTKIDVVARGAAGAGQPCDSYCYGTYFGRAGRVHALIPVKPGERLYVFVGGEGSAGTGGFNGGGDAGPGGGAYGGGGATDVREGGNALSDRVLVAGGGGGQGGSRDAIGGSGGGKSGAAGGSYCYYTSSSCYAGGAGTGGTQDRAGSGGAGGNGSGPSENGSPGNPGRLGFGGAGGSGGCYYRGSCSCGYADGCPGGGGGGGYYGGGGAGGGGGEYASIYGGPGGGGGGGSAYVEPNAPKFQTWTGWKKATGDGLVVFSW